jgi:hypothetical protein
MFQTSKLLCVISPYVKWNLWFWIHHEQKALLEFLDFKIGNFDPKNQIWWGEWWAKTTPCHFGHIDFTMFNVNWVVFLIGKIKTI